ncbi:GNAT family N-acetyltransferase [Cryobacterium psychrophilum]|uniref:GNAT family N-acetyltransferase n=1 Tax=Cryobacterium psychrophilum TaxID=41988 RepID=UPI0010D35C21|nr:GNAT family N-acetyltransferase [Cryobacterium psychrophilum]TDW30426.1 acetyltransferase (GNAT) family protein [Cryobacterium psychrophilum]
MQFSLVRFSSPEVAPLLAGLRLEYNSRYGAGAGDSTEDVPAEEFEAPNGGFLVLLDGEHTVAGGGIHRFDAETAEIKRMWTNPDYRRQGHARSILRALEALAGRLGFARVRLETGYAQPEALALYRSLGYRDIGNYGIFENASGFERTLSEPEAAVVTDAAASVTA